MIVCPCEITVGLVTLHFDGLSVLLAELALLLGTLVVFYSSESMAGEPGESKYYAMLVAMVGMMIGLGGAYDLFNLWLWFEGMAISSYLLVAFYRERPSTLEASVKHLVQSSLGSVLVLLGIALIFGITGQLRFGALAQATAAATQPPFLGELNRLRDAGQARHIRPLWIINAVAATLSPEAQRQVAAIRKLKLGIGGSVKDKRFSPAQPAVLKFFEEDSAAKQLKENTDDLGGRLA